ncbi:MAG: hypothetical protein N3E49_02355 [Bacteroidia bacterium]|nr:hypothetical protein [Bacteroidia bacterium]
MRLAIVGTGRMGHTLATLALQKGYSIASHVGRLSPELWGTLSVEVVIDFSHPSQVPALVEACLHRSIPLVTGTTGWYERLPDLRRLAETTPNARWLWGGNFSRGVLLLKSAIRAIFQMWGQLSDWEAALVETHHRHKKDAPSGTALELRRHFPALKTIYSLRLGEVVGEHRILLSGPGEEVELLHRAHDRIVFAEGALWAAQWLLQQQRFVGSFEEALSSGRMSNQAL